MEDRNNISPEILNMMACEYRNEAQDMHNMMDNISGLFKRFKELENTYVGSHRGSRIEMYYGAYHECLPSMKKLEEVLKETATFLDATARELEPIGGDDVLIRRKFLN